MSWQAEYKSKLRTAEEAVQNIKSGDIVVLGHCVSEPVALVRAMVANASAYKGVRIQQLLSVSEAPYAAEDMKEHFRFEAFFCSQGNRRAVTGGYGDVIPVYFSDVPKYIRQGILPIDVCLVLVSEPDDEGYVYIACEAGMTYQAVLSAKLVIAQVTSHAPQIFGDTKIHVSDIDVFVEIDDPLPTSSEIEIGPVQQKIGDYCASLVEDGSTIQVGLGGIPNAVMNALADKKHLGVHTELISDGILRLYEAGVIDNSRKNLDQGKIVATLVLGSRKLYDFCHRNPEMILRTVDYTNAPYIVAKQPKMVAINAAIEVDLYGQVVSESIGKRHFSGVGGQVDFVRGAALSEDGLGKAVITLSSTATLRDGTVVSRISPFLREGTPVTVNRYDVDYIVTEYGIAHLKGKSLQQRGRDLIQIAHPDFREGLEKAFFEHYHVLP